jgi:thioredoxin reductase/Fe-S-cluster-containing hydrogenase component 2/CRP-like cAMP-binding protein
MTDNRFAVAVVGSGPGGLSAVAQAAQLGLSHVLLEAGTQVSNTIFQYPKGKHVMAEPAVLPLRSAMHFTAGSRESVLETWEQDLARLGANVRYRAEVSRVEGSRGQFVLTLADGEIVHAETVVLAVGLQGNQRKLDVPGADLDRVLYQLDDPEAYQGETIAVIGAGDSAIENALALAGHNEVLLINRRDAFTRAKDDNIRAVLQAEQQGLIDCLYGARPLEVVVSASERRGSKPLRLVLQTSAGLKETGVDRVIARLGAAPPRGFLEACGVTFPSDDPNAVPELSAGYETQVPGLFVVGALAGYPLIKQALNQGYEVAEIIKGNPVVPADEALLQDKVRSLGNGVNVATAIELVRGIPLFSSLTALQTREFLLDSEIQRPESGLVLVRAGDYVNSFFSILAGQVQVEIQANESPRNVSLGVGDTFGEMSLITGRPPTTSVRAVGGCVLIKSSYRAMARLMYSVDAIRDYIDETFVRRAIQTHIAPTIPETELNRLVKTATLKKFSAGTVLFEEGAPGDAIHFIRRGSVTVSRVRDDREMVLVYLPANSIVGELAVLTGAKRSATVRATVYTETISIPASEVSALLQNHPEIDVKMRTQAADRLQELAHRQATQMPGDLTSFLMTEGAGEATDILLIDESICIRCDNCEKACAETHGGTSRLDREAGPTFASLHVPTSCRHCEHPHCMKDCPPDAIHRATNGEVFIADTCIGCGNCEQNCPYGVIQMVGKPREKRDSGLLSWLLFGRGIAPGSELKKETASSNKKAVKCDMCKNLSSGPACVKSCPTGAAIRVSPERFASISRKDTRTLGAHER